MPARMTIASDVWASVVDFRTADCSNYMFFRKMFTWTQIKTYCIVLLYCNSWEQARKAGFVYVCTEHDELKTGVVALRGLVRELKDGKYGPGSTAWERRLRLAAFWVRILDRV